MNTPVKLLRSFFGGREPVVDTSSAKAIHCSNGDQSTTTATPSRRSGFRLSPAPDPEPEDPVKRASDAQLAARKLSGRPQGPSVRFAKSFSSVTDTRTPSTTPSRSNFSATFAGTPRRLPGENPHKSYNHPVAARSTNHITTPRAALTSSSTIPRNLFSASTRLADRPVFAPSPRPRTSTLRDSLCADTPVKSRKPPAADITGSALAKTSSVNLFPSRISSPPPNLSGEALAKELPNDKNRIGSVYADEYLAHYCPPDLDDLQRRQFFCVLDMRRLKYAADEVFAKKDWQLNVLNFAREFEKSRSLILLHYGLYEFKTVKPSPDVAKQWKKDNNIPESEEEEQQQSVMPSYRVNGTKGILARTGKRKADDDLSKESALTESLTNPNKRRIAPDSTSSQLTDASALAPRLGKRKANDEPGENQPAKFVRAISPQVSAPVSATRAVFESLANNNNNHNSNASDKPMPSSNSKRSAPSIFGQPAQPAAANNSIFGYLAKPTNAIKDGGEPSTDDAEDGEDAGDEGCDVEASAGDDSNEVVNGRASSPTKTPSLFERLSYGKEGQPVRVLPPASEPEEKAATEKAPKPDKAPPASPAKAASPANNNTWSVGSPIKFAAPTTSTQPTASFGSASSSQQPTTTAATSSSSNMFASAATSEITTTPGLGPSALFGAAANTPSSSASSLFGKPPPLAAPSIFGGDAKTATVEKSAPTAAASIFGQAPSTQKTLESNNKSEPSGIMSSTTLFGQPESTEAAKDVAQTLSASTETQAADSQTTKQSAFMPSSSLGLFGQAAKPAKEAKTPSSTSLFGKPPATSAPSIGSTGTNPLFGASSAPSSTPSIFGSQPATSTKDTPSDKPSFSASSGPTSLFGSRPAEKSAGGDGEAKPADKTSNNHLFASFKPTTMTAPTTSQSLFSSSTTNGGASFASTHSGASIFGAKPTTTSTATETPSTTAPTFSFGARTQTTAPSVSFSNFSQQQPGASQATNSFGSTGGGGSSFNFEVGGVSNPFAKAVTAAAPSGGNRLSGQSIQSGSANFVSFGSNSTTQPPSFTAGGGGSSQPPTFSFTTAGSSANSGNPFQFSTSGSTPMFGAGGGLNSGLATTSGTSPSFSFGTSKGTAPSTTASSTPDNAPKKEEEKDKKDGAQESQADGDDTPQDAQVSLTKGGQGEEDESVVHEVRAKALRFEPGASDQDDAAKAKANPWKTMGLGPLRLLKHNTHGTVRMLLRAEPRGNVVFNKALMPDFSYKPESAPGNKYVKITVATDDGSGLETWMMQVKMAAIASALASALETHKTANKK